MQAVLKGDTEQFSVLMERYEAMVRSQARKAFPTPEEGEDFVQEVFLKAYESLSTFRGEAQFSSWLFQIARNLTHKQWKKKKLPMANWDNSVESASDPSGSSFSEDLVREEKAQVLKSLIAKLPLIYQTPIHLHYFENVPLKEISKTLDIKLGTIKSHISRGKELIRKWWDHEI